jgi:hypothetical protein
MCVVPADPRAVVIEILGLILELLRPRKRGEGNIRVGGERGRKSTFLVNSEVAGCQQLSTALSLPNDNFNWSDWN